MPSFGPRCSWRRRNSRKYLLLKEHRRRLMITNPKGAALLDPLINSIVPFEDQDLEMNNPTGFVPAGAENQRGNNVPNPAGEINNVVASGSRPPPVHFPRGFIGSGRISVRIRADNGPLVHDHGLRGQPMQFINARLEAPHYYVGESPGFARFFGMNRLLARENNNFYEEDSEEEEEEDYDDDGDDDDDDDDGDDDEEEEEDSDDDADIIVEEQEDQVMEAGEEKDDFTTTPSDLDEL